MSYLPVMETVDGRIPDNTHFANVAEVTACVSCYRSAVSVSSNKTLRKPTSQQRHALGREHDNQLLIISALCQSADMVPFIARD
jgi:hypothetical protein